MTQPVSYPSAGSVFKNPPGNFAGKLIEEVGLKGFRSGDAQVSELHANFIVNRGRAKAKHVLDLIGIIKDKVKKEKGVDLELEIEIVGEPK
jgi:UDP-N-acetylmuramate dehydrogenase